MVRGHLSKCPRPAVIITVENEAARASGSTHIFPISVYAVEINQIIESSRQSSGGRCPRDSAILTLQQKSAVAGQPAVSVA